MASQAGSLLPLRHSGGSHEGSTAQHSSKLEKFQSVQSETNAVSKSLRQGGKHLRYLVEEIHISMYVFCRSGIITA